MGTDARADLPLPPNVRRCYIAASTHGGGTGIFNTGVSGAALPASGPGCPGNNYGTGLLPANPMPHTETVSALRVHFRNWMIKGMEPPPSPWPTLNAGTLVAANKTAIGFSTLPQLRATVPEADFILPAMDYDWGPQFNAVDRVGRGWKCAATIRQVLPMLAPKVDADGNELGGVPVVLRDAPLETYLGWNLTAGGPQPFHQGQVCNYLGGMIPFAKTRAAGSEPDPRLSLEERYGSHAGYVAAVRKAAERALEAGFLLPQDAERVMGETEGSRVLR